MTNSQLYKKLERYYELLKELKLLNGTASLLAWDQETKMPQKNTEFRAEQMAYMSGLIHQKATDKELIKIVNDLYENKEFLDSVDARSIEVSKRDLDRVIKLPLEFVEEFSRTTSLAHEAWLEAKKTDDISPFKMLLEKIIDLTREKAEYIDSGKPIYDVLIDEYEEGMTTKKLDKIFSDLKEQLKPLILNIPERKRQDAFRNINFEKSRVEEFVIEMVKQIGFDFERGAVGEVHHPFETSLSPHDVRINMSYYHRDIQQTITGAIHELGHGLYEQNVDPDLHHTDLSRGISLGIHESQSRLLENMIGRSKPFWEFFTPRLKEFFRADINIQEVLNDLNIVKPSFIRIEADEVTYNMHIILRYEIELLLLNKEIGVNELEATWNDKLKELLGIVPDRLSIGALQDVHWSMGGFGYFPTYTLGNLNAGQLWKVFTAENMDWESRIASGDFSVYSNWFKDRIWGKGSLYKPMELMKDVTGEETNSEYLVDYLKHKFVK